MFENIIDTKARHSGIQIARKYVYEFKLHKTPGELNRDHVMALAAQIYGDFQIRVPAEDEARIYSQAGADVYMLHLDVDGLNGLDGKPSCCGLSHGKELLYQFGTSRDRVWRIYQSDWNIIIFFTPILFYSKFFAIFLDIYPFFTPIYFSTNFLHQCF